jgi:hypothetical protein
LCEERKERCVIDCFHVFSIPPIDGKANGFMLLCKKSFDLLCWPVRARGQNRVSILPWFL